MYHNLIFIKADEADTLKQQVSQAMETYKMVIHILPQSLNNINEYDDIWVDNYLKEHNIFSEKEKMHISIYIIPKTWDCDYDTACTEILNKLEELFEENKKQAWCIPKIVV